MKLCELREYKWNIYVTIAVNRNLSNCEIARKKRVFAASTGFEPVASAFALHCSASWAKTHALEAGQFIYVAGETRLNVSIVRWAELFWRVLLAFCYESNKWIFTAGLGFSSFLKTNAYADCEIADTGGGGGGGGTQQSFILGGSAPGSKPLPFYIPLLIEKVPLSYTCHRKWYPFHIPTERLLLNLSLQKPPKMLGWISHWVRLFKIFWMSLLIPKWQFSQPFSIFQLVKSLPFYTPPAWTGYPFRAEPPRVVHYREYPPGLLMSK